MSPDMRNRPTMASEAVSDSARTQSQDTGAPRIPHLTADEIANSRPLYILVVKTVAERVTRRTYLSLPAAEKACKRAQARGHAVTLELHRVVPYTVGAELHEAVNADA